MTNYLGRLTELLRLRPMCSPLQKAWISNGWPIDDFVHMDVGAAGGVSNYFGVPKEHWRTIAFDPDPRARLPEENWKSTVFKTALSTRDGKIKLYLTKEPENSSVYRPNQVWRAKFDRAERMQMVGETTLDARSLDSLRQEFPDAFGQGIDFIKLDTQGSELDILRGGMLTLKDVFAVQVEVEFVPHYLDQPLFSDVDHFLREQGLILFDIRRVYWKKKMGSGFGGLKGQLVHGDALYLRDNEVFLKSLRDVQGRQETYLSRIVKSLDICLRYGCNDHALELFELATDRGLVVSDAQQRVIRQAIEHRKVRTHEPSHVGYLTLAILAWISSKIDGVNKGYDFGDKYLSNRF